MNLLILKGFNNYFNRIIKRYTTLAEYISHSEANYDFSDINFNPNDGVTTTQVIGSTTQQQTGGVEPTPLAWEHDGYPDYLIAYETEQVGIATVNTIKSRWFIKEPVRTRNGQYSLKLKRDSIADNLDSLLSCPAFIKKGTVSDDNPLIVNDEGITVNRIKSGETLLKDKTGSAWIVGYMAKNAPNTTITEQIADDAFSDYVTIEDIASDFGVDASDLSDALTEDQENSSYFVNDNIELVGWINYVDNSPTEYRLIAGSQNFLSSFSYGRFAEKQRSSTADCFSKTISNPNYPNDNNRPIGPYGNSTQSQKLADIWKNACESNKAAIVSSWKTMVGHPLFAKGLFNRLKQMQDNNTLLYKQGKYYRVRTASSSGPKNTGESYYYSSVAIPMSTICSTTISNWNTWASSQGHWYDGGRWNCWPYLEARTSGKIFINYNELIVNFFLEEVTSSSDIPGITITMSSTRNVIMDQPYDMFAIPFNNTTLVNGLDEYEVVGEYAQKVAMALVKKLTASNVYDIQLLPYCPIPEMVGDGEIDVSNLSSGYDYDFITKTNQTMTFVSKEYPAQVFLDETYEVRVTIDKPAGTGTLTAADITLTFSNSNHTDESITIISQSLLQIELDILFDKVTPYPTAPKVSVSWNYTSPNPIIKSIIIYPKSNSFSVDLNYSLSLIHSMKIDSQTDLYRLVSPNYQGSFDFNVAKNGGTVNGFIADCTYKPYTPYIKVSPNFAWLYGTNFGDCRGLICGGDFSIGFLQDAWENYQLNNKNYQNIFNREIQNLDVNQSIQRTQQYVTGGLNIARDTIAGGVAGGIATGSPYGAIAGGVLGGIGSGVGYGMDINLMEKGLQEQRQFSIDKFKMQLGNIQALPYTLTKVGAFNINSKVFPFLEYYTCSEQEKEALINKIQYEGMTVGIIDLLGNYMGGGYVQADLIRNEAIIEDSHLLDDIYIELTKGVYM